VRGRQCRRIVEAVPHHQDAPAAGGEVAETLHLIGWRRFRLPTANAAVVGGLRDGGLPVAGEQFDGQSQVAKSGYCRGRIRAQAIGESEASRPPSRFGEPHFGMAVPGRRLDIAEGRRAQSRGALPKALAGMLDHTGGQTVPSWDRFMDLAWFSARSLPFLAIGVAVGAVLAAVAFTVGAFSMPYLLDRRQSNLVKAIATSVAAVRLDIRPMLLRAGLLVVLVTMAMVPGLLGLVVVLPVIAHATWHAYRDIVQFGEA